jgi:uncharacterized RDD family membrane protein YckC
VNAAAGPEYAGLVTRAVAFVMDAAIISGVWFVVGASIALVLSLFGSSVSALPDTLVDVVAVGGWFLLQIVYFTGSWTLTGQTPGMRVMSVRAQRTGGGHISVWRGLRRLIGMFISMLLLFTGFLIIPFDRRCRGLHDRIAGTVVVFISREEQKVRPIERGLAAEREREREQLSGGATAQ